MSGRLLAYCCASGQAAVSPSPRLLGLHWRVFGMIRRVARDSWRLSGRKVCDALLAALGLLFCASGQLLPDPGAALSVVALAQFGYCLVVVRENRLLLLMYGVMAYAAYSIGYANYLNPITTTMFTSLAGTPHALVAMQMLVLFSSALVLFLPQRVEPYGVGDDAFVGERGNAVIVYALVAVLALILIYGFGRPDAIGGRRGSPSPLYEYSIIFFIAAFYMAGRQRWLRSFVLGMLLLFAAQNLVYGGRVTALQLLVVAFFCLANGRTSNRALIAGGALLLVFFVGFGGVRTEIWESGLVAVLQSFADTLSKGLAWDTAYSSWHTSVTFVAYDELVGFEQHAYLLRQWVASIILGGSAVADSGLAALTRAYFPHYYGGVLPVFVWFYLGPLGTAAVAAYVSLFAKQIAGLRSASAPDGALPTAARLCLVYVVATTPRWFLYSPSQITRGLLLCFAVCFALLWLDRAMERKRADARPAEHGKGAAVS